MALTHGPKAKKVWLCKYGIEIPTEDLLLQNSTGEKSKRKDLEEKVQCLLTSTYKVDKMVIETETNKVMNLNRNRNGKMACTKITSSLVYENVGNENTEFTVDSRHMLKQEKHNSLGLKQRFQRKHIQKFFKRFRCTCVCLLFERQSRFTDPI